MGARTPAGNPIYRNPAAPHVIPVLPSVLTLIKALNGLWTPEAQTLLSLVQKHYLEPSGNSQTITYLHPQLFFETKKFRFAIFLGFIEKIRSQFLTLCSIFEGVQDGAADDGVGEGEPAWGDARADCG